jgi:hypothetical protein
MACLITRFIIEVEEEEEEEEEESFVAILVTRIVVTRFHCRPSVVFHFTHDRPT